MWIRSLKPLDSPLVFLLVSPGKLYKCHQASDMKKDWETLVEINLTVRAQKSGYSVFGTKLSWALWHARPQPWGACQRDSTRDKKGQLRHGGLCFHVTLAWQWEHETKFRNFYSSLCFTSITNHVILGISLTLSEPVSSLDKWKKTNASQSFIAKIKWDEVTKTLCKT